MSVVHNVCQATNYTTPLLSVKSIPRQCLSRPSLQYVFHMVLLLAAKITSSTHIHIITIAFLVVEKGYQATLVRDKTRQTARQETWVIISSDRQISIPCHA